MNLRTVLTSGRALIMDGAMGTELMRRGYTGPTWQANLDAPELVRAIHADYVAAGAQVLLTNTFLAAVHPEVVPVALTLARSVAGTAYVLAAFGPDFTDVFAHDADGVLVETCSDPAIFDVTHRLKSPVLVSFTYQQACRTFAGHAPETLATLAEAAGVAALGVNCGRDQTPEACGEVLRRYRSATSLPLFARPNAGSPGGRHYPPAEWAERVALCDAIMLGGCCGTTPEHIRVLKASRER